jgi:hypothetical protein
VSQQVTRGDWLRQAGRASGTELDERRFESPVVPKVVPPLDSVQSWAASQSLRLSPPNSSSHRSSAELRFSALPERLQILEQPRAFRLMKSWDGIVTGIGSETFVSRIVPLDGLGLEQEAEFLLTDVPEADRPLIRRGAPFYWFVGYDTSLGRRRRTSELKMRRLRTPLEPPAAWLEQTEAIVAGTADSRPTEG